MTHYETVMMFYITAAAVSGAVLVTFCHLVVKQWKCFTTIPWEILRAWMASYVWTTISTPQYGAYSVDSVYVHRRQLFAMRYLRNLSS